MNELGAEDTVRGMHFTRDSVPGASHESWRSYNKRAVTRAKRIDGPFSVETREGLLTCRDGYLAIDAHGWPYPIAREEFELIYEPYSSKTAGGELAERRW